MILLIGMRFAMAASLGSHTTSSALLTMGKLVTAHGLTAQWMGLNGRHGRIWKERQPNGQVGVQFPERVEQALPGTRPPWDRRVVIPSEFVRAAPEGPSAWFIEYLDQAKQVPSFPLVAPGQDGVRNFLFDLLTIGSDESIVIQLIKHILSNIASHTDPMRIPTR